MERCSVNAGPLTIASDPCCSCSKGAALQPRSRTSFLPQEKRDSRRHICHGTDPALMQDVIMGASVVAAVGASVVAGLKSEPEICQSCAGTGGVKCFACEGTGKMAGVPLEELAKAAAASRDPLGRNISKRECVACKGAGMLFCKKCNGSGYVSK